MAKKKPKNKTKQKTVTLTDLSVNSWAFPLTKYFVLTQQSYHILITLWHSLMTGRIISLFLQMSNTPSFLFSLWWIHQDNRSNQRKLPLSPQPHLTSGLPSSCPCRRTVSALLHRWFSGKGAWSHNWGLWLESECIRARVRSVLFSLHAGIRVRVVLIVHVAMV
jgi:hypothetical protein